MIELISVLAISSFLILVSAVGFSVFFTKFKELSKWAELQSGAYEAMMMIRNGVAVPENATPRDQVLFGVANASKITIIGSTPQATSGSGIQCIPPISEPGHDSDKIRIYFDGRSVRAWYAYGPFSSAAPIYLFPRQDQLNEIQVTNFKVYKKNQGEEIKIIQVDLSARIKTSPNKFRSINYSTLMTSK